MTMTEKKKSDAITSPTENPKKRMPVHICMTALNLIDQLSSPLEKCNVVQKMNDVAKMLKPRVYSHASSSMRLL